MNLKPWKNPVKTLNREKTLYFTGHKLSALSVKHKLREPVEIHVNNGEKLSLNMTDIF